MFCFEPSTRSSYRPSCPPTIRHGRVIAPKQQRARSMRADRVRGISAIGAATTPSHAADRRGDGPVCDTASRVMAPTHIGAQSRIMPPPLRVGEVAVELTVDVVEKDDVSRVDALNRRDASPCSSCRWAAARPLGVGFPRPLRSVVQTRWCTTPAAVCHFASVAHIRTRHAGGRRAPARAGHGELWVTHAL